MGHKENWWSNCSKEGLKKYQRKDGRGADNPTRQFILDFIQDIDKEELKVLDAGCGTGVDYQNLKKLNIDYTGVDITPKVVEVAKDLFPKANFVQGDIEDLQFDDGEFDVVFARHVIEHLESYSDAVEEMKRVADKRVIVLHHKLTRAKKEKLDENTWNNYYNKKIVKACGEDAELIEFDNQDVIVF